MNQAIYSRIIGSVVVSLLTSCHAHLPAAPAIDASVLTRTVDHAMGTSEIPATPERVVVLDTAPLDAALALGIQPVGTVTYGTFPPYLEAVANDITIVGDSNQPNLEAILQLQPDLILSSKTGSPRSLYRRLSQIAPTVFAPTSGRELDWQENFRLYAEALNQSELADQLLQRYQAQAQRLGEALGQQQTLEISVLSTYSNRIGTYTTGSFPGSVLQDVGLSRPSAQDITRRYAREFSSEALEDLDGDYIFLIHSPDFPGGVQKEDFMRAPIWSQLQAVQQDQVCEVTGTVWTAGRSILAANQILADIGQCLEPQI